MITVEYCICEAFDDDFVMAKEITANGTGGLRDSSVLSAAAEGGGGGPGGGTDGGDSAGRRSMAVSGDGSGGGANTLTVYIPHVGPMYVPLLDGVTTLRDLLPIINKKHRLRLYTDQYEFIISQDEKERLKLAVPVFGLDTIIATSGVKEVELRKKLFADASKLVPGKLTTANCLLRALLGYGTRYHALALFLFVCWCPFL